MSVNGRDNNGHLLTFMMGYVQAETEECDEWMLSAFWSCYGVAPKFICLDHAMQGINAARKVLHESIQLLDEYHLNKNQLANCNTLLGGNGPLANKQFYQIRRSPTEDAFLARRAAFEMTYLNNFHGRGVLVNGKTIPRWYYNVFYVHKERVVQCFNRYRGGLRFGLQGSGYSESSNAYYKRHIQDLKVRFCEIPLEMQRLSESANSDRERSRTKFNKTHFALKRTIFVPGFAEFVDLCTPYAVSLYLEELFRPSQDFDIIAEQHHVHEHVLYLYLRRRTGGAGFTRPVAVSAKTVRWKGKDERVIIARFDCFFGVTSGLPCKHISRLMAVWRNKIPLPQDTARFVQVPPNCVPRIDIHAHPYWHRDAALWKNLITSSRVQRAPTEDRTKEEETQN